MSGQVAVSNREFLFRIGQGLEPGWSYEEIFGNNPDIDTATVPEDVWSQGGLYIFSTTADIDKLSSSSVADTQDIIVYGLTADYTFVLQQVTLNGQNKVTLATPLMRVYRMINVGSTDNAGDIYCYVDGTITSGVPDTASDIRAKMAIGANESEMATYTIPKDRVGYYVGGYGAMSKQPVTAAAGLTVRIRPPGGTFAIKSRIQVSSSGSNWFQYRLPVPAGPLATGTDIIIRTESVTANDVGCSAGFTVLLRDA